MSDPNFPASMASQYKGMKIEFFKEIYRRYSDLNFTYEADRSLGMAGIERRLERVFKATAWYGILHDPNDPSYLRRSLLWRSSQGASLLKDSTNAIDYPADRRVPTWSWMAVKGSIEYMPAPFGEMDWNLDLDLEFAPSIISDGIQKNQPTGILKGAKFPISTYTADEHMSSDNHRIFPPGNLSGVIVGREKIDTSVKLQKHYILLIAPSELGDLHKRIGVAIILRKPSWIPEESTPVRIA